jgi:hypothetical protein
MHASVSAGSFPLCAVWVALVNGDARGDPDTLQAFVGPWIASIGPDAILAVAGFLWDDEPHGGGRSSRFVGGTGTGAVLAK